jgi:hypothetical protein
MKRIVFLIIILISCINSLYSQKLPNPSFRKLGNLDEIFVLAKKENKPVFLEAYLPTCHHCLAYEETLKKNEIKNYLSKNYHAYQIDLSQKEANLFLRKNKIYIATTPTFIIFSPEGKLWNIQAAGEETNNIKDIIRILDYSKDPNKRQQALLEKYNQGTRDFENMVSIASFTRLKLDTTKNIEVVNELIKSMNPESFGNEMSFLIVQKLMMDEANPLFDHLINNLDTYSKKFDTLAVKMAVENTVMTSLYNKNTSTYSSERLQKMKDALARIGVPEKQIAARFIYIEVMKELKNNKPENAIANIKKYYGSNEIPIKEKEFWCKTVLKFMAENTACPL